MLGGHAHILCGPEFFGVIIYCHNPSALIRLSHGGFDAYDLSRHSAQKRLEKNKVSSPQDESEYDLADGKSLENEGIS
jgi:hypothetical protein